MLFSSLWKLRVSVFCFVWARISNMTNSDDTKITWIWKISSLCLQWRWSHESLCQPQLPAACECSGHCWNHSSSGCVCRGVHCWATAGLPRDCCSHKLGQSFTIRLVIVICSESVCWTFSWQKILPYLYCLQKQTGKQYFLSNCQILLWISMVAKAKWL